MLLSGKVKAYDLSVQGGNFVPGYLSKVDNG